MNTNHQAIRYLERVGRWLMAGMLAFLLFAGQIATQSRTTSASVSNTSVPAPAMDASLW